MIEILILLVVFILTGMLCGFLSACFGFGGGLVMIPLLSWTFYFIHFPTSLTLPMAIATSLATLLVNASNASTLHWKKKTILWDVIYKLAPFIGLGSFLGALSASYMNSMWLRYFFISYLIFTMGMLIIRRGIPTTKETITPLTWFNSSIFGLFVGLLSSWVGIGGAVLTAPFLKKRGYPLRYVAATASVLTVPLTFIGTLGYVFLHLNDPALPAFSLGLVYLPAFVGLIGGSLIGLPLGMRFVFQSKELTLENIQIGLLLCVTLSMIAQVLKLH